MKPFPFILGWLFIVCGCVFGVVFIFFAIRNFRAGGYQQFSIKRFFFQKATALQLKSESPVHLLLCALLGIGSAILIYVMLF
jgi:hypothetical protein